MIPFSSGEHLQQKTVRQKHRPGRCIHAGLEYKVSDSPA